MQRKLLFMIPSTIYLSTNSLSYTSVRSVFSAEDRARQTLKTIQSIRSLVPDAQIVLIEAGLEKGLPYHLEDEADIYLYLGNRSIVRKAADGPFKGLGEAISLYLANRCLLHFQADYFFKLSGRYYLSEQFDVNNWLQNGYTGKEYYESGLCGLYTVLYGFPGRLYQNWRHSLKASIPGLFQGRSIELIQPQHMDSPICFIPEIGVCGWIAPSGVFVSL